MGLPTKAEVKRALKKLEKAEGTLAKPANPTALEKFRWDIQQKFVSYKLDRKMSQKELAGIIGIDESKMSKILHNRLEEFSTDRLITLYERLDPHVKLRVG